MALVRECDICGCEIAARTNGYIRFKVVETEKDMNSIGKERVGGRACK